MQETKMESLQEEGSNYSKKIEEEKMLMNEYMKEIAILELKLSDKKKSLSSSDGKEIPYLQKI